MGTFIEMRVTGDRQIQRLLSTTMPREVADAVERVIGRHTQLAHAVARTKAPVSSGGGELRRSIQMNVRRAGLSSEGKVGVDSPELREGRFHYALAIEYGRGVVRPVRAKMLFIPLSNRGKAAVGREGRVMPGTLAGLEFGRDFVFAHSAGPALPQPFMRPAFDEVRKTFLPELKQEVGKALDRAKGTP